MQGAQVQILVDASYQSPPGRSGPFSPVRPPGLKQSFQANHLERSCRTEAVVPVRPGGRTGTTAPVRPGGRTGTTAPVRPGLEWPGQSKDQ